MAVKTRELKDDILLDIKVNKTFYFMLKSSLFYLFQSAPGTPEEKAETFKKISKTEYKDLNEFERTFYTISLILAEIERLANATGGYVEGEILEPGDEGYVAPTVE
jgi:hypothetical protein